MRNVHKLESVGRGGETQIQVGTNLNQFNLAGKTHTSVHCADSYLCPTRLNYNLSKTIIILDLLLICCSGDLTEMNCGKINFVAVFYV